MQPDAGPDAWLKQLLKNGTSENAEAQVGDKNGTSTV